MVSLAPTMVQGARLALIRSLIEDWCLHWTFFAYLMDVVPVWRVRGTATDSSQLGLLRRYVREHYLRLFTL